MPSIVTVTNQEELINALRAATGGETILLASGDYGELRLIDKSTFELDFDTPVTIAAADAENPPTVARLDLRGATNLHFEHVLFDYTYQAGQPIWDKPFMVSGSDGISFSDCTFDGDVASGLSAADNGYPTGFGLYVYGGSSNVTVSECEIQGFFRGMCVANSDNIVVVGNDIHSIRMDGMNFSAVQGVVIEENYIHDFDRSMNSADHSDMIQFWTNGTTRPSTDIVIRNNVLDIGDGHYTQSIFMRNDLVDRGIAGEEMFYRNVTIEGNVISNGHLHGITVGETEGLTIRNNSVLHNDGADQDGTDNSVEIPRINVAASSQNVTITSNAVASISGFSGQEDWTVVRNAFVQDQDRGAPGWYGDVFISSTLSSTEGAAGIRVNPEGMMARLGAGAPIHLSSPTTSEIDAAFNTHSDSTSGTIVNFDASPSTGVQPEGTVYRWDFGDGQTGTGLNATHRYADGGEYQATLSIILPDGTTVTETSRVTVLGNEILSLSEDGTFLASSNGIATDLNTISKHDVDGGIQLGGTGISASVARNHLQPVFGSEDVTISLRLDADAAGATGEVLRLHGSFIVAVDSRGAASVRAWSSEGDAVKLASSGVVVNDGASHDIDIRLQGGWLSLWVDGEMVQDAAFNGTLADVGRHDMTFGNPWHSGFFNGDVTDFSIMLDDKLAMPDPFTELAIDLIPPLA